MQRSNIVHTTLPPFATDLPDSAYRSPQARSARRQVEPAAQPRPTSAYDHYDEMLEHDESAAGIGAGFMSGALPSDDESDTEAAPPVRGRQAILAEAINYRRTTASIPVASPRPGYASKPAVLDTAIPTPSPPHQRPPPGLSQPTPRFVEPKQEPKGSYGSEVKDPTKFDGGLAGSTPYLSPAPPYATQLLSPSNGKVSAVPIAPSLPVNPQLNAGPNTLFKPAFLKSRDSVRFNDESAGFIRGGAEGMVIPRRGARGDNFWRRFSVIAKDKGKLERSSWLRTTQSGTKTLSRGVWIISVVILLCIAGGVGAGWYFGHKDTSLVAPKALGGTGDHGQAISSSASAKGKSSTSSPHVSPTYTVARRAAMSIPTNHSRRRFHI